MGMFFVGLMQELRYSLNMDQLRKAGFQLMLQIIC